VKASVEKIFQALRNTIPELKAAVLVSNAGEFDVASIPGFAFDAETFAAEYAALFRIAIRTAEDTAMGDAFEQILVSDKAIVLARRFGSDDVAVFVCGPDQPLGRLRYEIRRLAQDLIASAA
jgi:predicted regulator of Ras-like GTPase activity (Roadblock/LC7/MglB family)